MGVEEHPKAGLGKQNGGDWPGGIRIGKLELPLLTSRSCSMWWCVGAPSIVDDVITGEDLPLRYAG